MSRSEEITSEVRRLVLTCRSMEAQLQQSLPKKTHQEVVAKMQATIDGLVAELGRTKADLQETTHLEEKIKGLSEQISSQTEAITGQWQSNDVKRIAELEEKISNMVDKSEFLALQNKYDEIKTLTVPKEDYITLQNQFSNFVPREIFEEMQRSFSQTTVPREKLLATEARMQELETRIANSIPRSDHDELVAQIVSLIGEAPRPSDASEANATGTEVAIPLVTSGR
ncbi:MAG: hypothetical protein ACYCPP_07640 [Nitrososphaerales archaeon]